MARPRGQEQFQPSGEVTRVVSLNGGTWMYVFGPDGKTRHLRRDDPAVIEVCGETHRVTGNVVETLRGLGWDDLADAVSIWVDGGEESPTSP
jgi:hypothetical protein